MLAIGRGIASSPQLLLLDEPSMGLAPAIADLIFDRITALHREDGVTLLLVAVLLVVVGAAFIFLPSLQRNFNAGFGPDWECTPQGQGGPTCIKKIGRQN